MSSVAPGTVAGPLPATSYQGVIIDGRVQVPAWVHDLPSFRRWAQSEQCPENGDVAYLAGQTWVDLSMEELLTHGRVRYAFTSAFMSLLEANPVGEFVLDRMRLSNPAADLSAEPDGLFYFWETAHSGKLRFVEGAKGGIVELEGTPDLVLEIVSATSVHKDTVRLPELYWRAGIREYWLVDARQSEPRFDIFRHGTAGYEPTEKRADGMQSQVLGVSVRLTVAANPLGQAVYKVTAS